MKSRLLKKILNNTGYIVSNHKEYIAIGSSLCHDLISVNKETNVIKYALDTFHEGRKCLEDKDNEKLLFIWDKLHEMVKDNTIQNIMFGTDAIENPLTVYTVEDGKLVETFTDEYGWPNVTIEGYIMYENTYFDNKKDAINYGIKDYSYCIKSTKENILYREEELKKHKNDLDKYNKYLEDLKKELNE